MKIRLKNRIFLKILGMKATLITDKSLVISFAFWWKDEWIAVVYKNASVRLELVPEVTLSAGRRTIRVDIMLDYKHL